MLEKNRRTKIDNEMLDFALNQMQERGDFKDSSEKLQEAQKGRKEIEDGDIVQFHAPKEVLLAMSKGEPFDKSKVRAINPERQEELDEIIGATNIDKLKRKVTSFFK